MTENLNKRQQYIVSALKTTNTSIRQARRDSTSAWFVWDRNRYWIRLTAICKDVADLVQKKVLVGRGQGWSQEFVLAG